MELVELAKKLISFPSVTPDEAGCLDYIQNLLADAGFYVERLKFGEVDNLYAKIGEGKNFCFAGHIDVVPPGDEARWTNPPFEPVVKNGVLYGRGASDMKAAIAAMLAAAMEYKDKGCVSFLLTSDEEGPGVDGTKRVLEELAGRGEKIDACIVGEPTNPEKLGQMAKTGRRGSMNCTITVQGKQGHAAYPHNADNPVKKLIDILYKLQNHVLDSGSKAFDPSNLEVVTVDVGNKASNVIPAQARAVLNIRFNDHYKSPQLKSWIEGVIGEDKKVTLEYHVSGESFLTKIGKLSDIVADVVKEVTGIKPEFSTTGGTSDARFIHEYAEVIEFGLINKSAHQVDENCLVDELEKLKVIYLKILQKFFQ